MTPTIFGLIVTALAIALMWRSVTATLCLMILCTLLGAASAIDLPALGGSSIQPAHVALGFLLIRLGFSRHARLSQIGATLQTNVWLVAYASYGVLGAFVLPRLFAGAVDLVPMKIVSTLVYDMRPLRFGSQNITTAVYILGTLMAALAATMVVRGERRTDMIVSACLGVAWLHIFMGLLDLGLSAAHHAEWLDVLRNGGYSQLSQEVSGVKRISGSFSETSSYSLFAFNWLVFATELRLRGVRPGWTGATAVAMALILLLTTSSTAYLGLGAYGVVLFVRAFVTPMRPPVSVLIIMFALVLTSISAVLGFIVLKPHVWAHATEILHKMTVDKMNTQSGVQRALWAKQGFEAFVATFGLGAGPGSFRSSSLVSSIIGSAGVIGITTFVLHLIVMLKPFRTRSHDLRVRGEEAVGRAAAWTAIVALIPASFIAASPDPGLLFAIFSGIALGTRAQRGAVPMRRPIASSPRPLVISRPRAI